MIIQSIRYDLPISDVDFDKLYSPYIQSLSELHWTSIEVAKKAASFLVQSSDTKVLDIGSGVGKFCIVGASTTSGVFYGVEQRKELVDISRQIISDHHVHNVKILHSNIIDIDFSNYNSYYFFNSFYENIEESRMMDCSVTTSNLHYQQYRDYMYLQLLKAPIGTRLATYCCIVRDIPSCYTVYQTSFNHQLKLWIKDKSSLI